MLTQPLITWPILVSVPEKILKCYEAYADTNMLSIIVRNLITNSMKYSSSGNDIIISSKQNKNHTSISVRDFGKGMSKELMQQIFRADFIESQRGTKGEKGTGIGLSLCKEFVDKHGGRIELESELNKGSTFTIFLPKAQK